jgi:hypothetical protein
MKKTIIRDHWKFRNRGGDSEIFDIRCKQSYMNNADSGERRERQCVVSPNWAILISSQSESQASGRNLKNYQELIFRSGKSEPFIFINPCR